MTGFEVRPSSRACHANNGPLDGSKGMKRVFSAEEEKASLYTEVETGFIKSADLLRLVVNVSTRSPIHGQIKEVHLSIRFFVAPQ